MSDNFYKPPNSNPNTTGNKYSFFDTQGLAKVISFLFYGTAVFSLVSVWVSGSMIEEIRKNGAPDLSQGAETSIQSLEQGISFIGSVISIALIVNYLIWINKSYKNLYLLNATELNHSPGWAVGYWFIPFVNLVKPFQVVLEIYRASSLNYSTEPNSQWKELIVKPYVYWWWFIYVGNGVVGAFAGMQAANTADFEQVEFLINIYEISMFVDLVNAVNCFFAAKVVSEIASLQYQRYVRIHSGTDTFIA